MNNIPSTFTQNNLKNSKNTTVILPQFYCYYLALHLKLATTWYNSQLIEIFSYEVPASVSGISESLDTKFRNTSNSVVVYNFHNIFSQERIFIFTFNFLQNKDSTFLTHPLKSVASLFSNAN